MKELKVRNENGELLVSGRDLHNGLTIKSNYTTWFKRMCEYGFEEEIDYIEFWSDSKSGNAVEYLGSPQKMSAMGYEINHAIKIDMAKEICMLQRTEEGRCYRKYFIECERKLKEQQLQLDKKQQLQLQILNGSELERVSALKEYETVLTQPLLNQIEEQKPLVEFAETISKTADSIDIGTFSKVVKDEGIKMGRNKLFEYLRNNKCLRHNNEPYQKYIDNGYFEVIEYSYKTPYGEKLGTKTLITGIGQVRIVEKLRKEFN